MWEVRRREPRHIEGPVCAACDGGVILSSGHCSSNAGLPSEDRHTPVPVNMRYELFNPDTGGRHGSFVHRGDANELAEEWNREEEEEQQESRFWNSRITNSNAFSMNSDWIVGDFDYSFTRVETS